MVNNQGRELSWDEQIENDGPDFTLLPEGDYDFVVVEFERGRHPGSEKLPPCNKAVVHLRFEAPEGVTIVKHPLFLHTITEGMLCAFFVGIGQRKKGERVTMNWNAVVGSTGRAKLVIQNWTNDKGEVIPMNKVKKFYEPAEGKGFQAGRF